MRVTLLYIWLIAITLPIFSQWGTIAYYQLNKEYITRVLCKNRDKPQLHCNGHCFLAKKLKAQEEKKDHQTSERVQDLPSIHLFASPLTLFDFSIRHLSQNQKLTFPYHLAAYMAPTSIFSPPPCA